MIKAFLLLLKSFFIISELSKKDFVNKKYLTKLWTSKN